VSQQIRSVNYSLSSNGLFVLVNESGIHIGPTANINAANLILSTRDVTNENFLNGNYLFEKLSPKELDRLLLNQGTIQVHDGGFGVLVAGAVKNEGTIIAHAGTIALAGGDAVALNFAGNSLISVAIDTPTASTIVDYEGNPITTQVDNSGTLHADGGTIILKAESLPDIFTKAINLDGYVRASRIEEADGMVQIMADGVVTIGATVEATNIIIGSDDPTETLMRPTQVLMNGAAMLSAQELLSIVAGEWDIYQQTRLL